MQNKQLRIVFFGSSKYVIPILEVLRQSFDLSLVVTTENPKSLKADLASQGETLEPPVINYCIHHKLSYLSLQQFNNLTIKQLKLINASVGILASFGAIIPSKILRIFPKGIINIHPSLLPKHRGPTPVQKAILEGDKVTGISIIKLDDKIDHGPLLGQEKEEILPADTSESLYKRLFEKGANLLIKILDNYIRGNLKLITQNHKNATFTKLLTRQDGYWNLSNITTPVTKIDRMIRAYFPWPSVWTKVEINGKSKIIKFLPDQKIQVEGKRPMSYKDFINGYPDAAGIILPILQNNS